MYEHDANIFTINIIMGLGVTLKERIDKQQQFTAQEIKNIIR